MISVSLDHDVCCCAGLSRSGTEVKQIPLEQITDLVIDEQGQGWIQRCVPQVNPPIAWVWHSQDLVFWLDVLTVWLQGACPELGHTIIWQQNELS